MSGQKEAKFQPSQSEFHEGKDGMAIKQSDDIH